MNFGCKFWQSNLLSMASYAVPFEILDIKIPYTSKFPHNSIWPLNFLLFVNGAFIRVFFYTSTKTAEIINIIESIIKHLSMMLQSPANSSGVSWRNGQGYLYPSSFVHPRLDFEKCLSGVLHRKMLFFHICTGKKICKRKELKNKFAYPSICY